MLLPSSVCACCARARRATASMLGMLSFFVVVRCSHCCHVSSNKANDDGVEHTITFTSLAAREFRQAHSFRPIDDARARAAISDEASRLSLDGRTANFVGTTDGPRCHSDAVIGFARNALAVLERANVCVQTPTCHRVGSARKSISLSLSLESNQPCASVSKTFPLAVSM